MTIHPQPDPTPTVYVVLEFDQYSEHIYGIYTTRYRAQNATQELKNHPNLGKTTILEMRLDHANKRIGRYQ